MNYCIPEKSWIGILKETNVFQRQVAKLCENFLQKRKLGFSLLCDAYNNIDAYVCKCIELWWNKWFCLGQSWIGILKERNVFSGASSEVLTVVLWESRAWKLCTCQLFIQSILQATQACIYLTWCDDWY